jgi:hypothetical protein
MKKTILNISSKLLDRQVDFFKKLMRWLNGGGGIPTIIKEGIGYDKTTNVLSTLHLGMSTNGGGAYPL